MSTNLKFIYFGGEPLGVPVLEELEAAGLMPELVVCSPDRPVGRKQVLTPPPVKVWAESHGLPVWQPEGFRGEVAREIAEQFLAPYLTAGVSVFVVVAYNHILPEWLLTMPRYGAVNLHPSLLPALRGPSPIRSAILHDTPELVGVTVMLLDAEMDHGPILDQLPLMIAPEHWPLSGPKLDNVLARTGGELLADTLVAYVTDDIIPQEQPHEAASYTKKFTTADSEVAIDPFVLPAGDDAWRVWLAINAFAGMGGTFFMHNDTRIKINEASFTNGELSLITVTPEGRNELSFREWLASIVAK
ncbi:hypothetical protein KC887_07785 [Candidatus Kaiserbacteria bacterium]|nr:hypothetical protein [Candidatus Kaiserbacteria bacterium]